MQVARWLVVVVALTLAFASNGIAAPAKAELSEKELQERALKLNSEIRTEDDFSGKMKELFKDKKGTALLVKAAAKLQKASKEDEKPPFRFYAALALGRAAQFVRDYEAAELFYNFATKHAINDLQSGKLIATAAENLLDHYADRKKYDKMNKLCTELLELDGDETVRRFQFLVVLEKQIQALSKLGEFKKAMEQADSLIKKTDNYWMFLQLRGQIQREQGKFDDSIKTYEEVIEKIKAEEKMPEDDKKRYVRNVRYLISGIHVENSKIDKGAEILQGLLKEDPENATFHNDLGFVWCDHNMKLDESEKLIRKAIELDLAMRKKALDEGKIEADQAKNANSAYLDSLGWVLYKKKKYDEAIKYLLQAASSDDEESNHIEIWDHVGDCYMAMGKKKEALETFQKALKADDITKKDVERRRKVVEKMNKLKAELKDEK